MKKKYGAKKRPKDNYVKNDLDNFNFENFHNRQKPKKLHTCSKCKNEKNFEEFGIFKSNDTGWFDIEGYRRKWHCRDCDNKYNKTLHKNSPEKRLYNLAKRRAKDKNLEFNLTKEYIKSIFPKDNKCPVTGKEFQYGLKNRDYAPSIDKINPKKGYIIGNVVIISHKMNAFKSDIEDIELIKKLYDFYKKFSN